MIYQLATHYGAMPNQPKLDCGPLLNDMHIDAAEKGHRQFYWLPGSYHFHTQPDDIALRGLQHIAAGRGTVALWKRFPSEPKKAPWLGSVKRENATTRDIRIEAAPKFGSFGSWATDGCKIVE